MERVVINSIQVISIGYASFTILLAFILGRSCCYCGAVGSVLELWNWRARSKALRIDDW